VKSIAALAPADCANYTVCVFTENLEGIAHLVACNEATHAANKGFILGETLGVTGYTFLDYGENHSIFDANGEDTKNFIVVNISPCEGGAVVQVHEDKRHTFEDGDYVNFIEVEGMTGINKKDPILIKNCKAYSFELVCPDIASFGVYERQGIVENIKVAKPVSYHRLAQSMVDPVASTAYGMLETPDMRFWGRSNHIHAGIRALH
jgi:ubiquitin-activating enzyme E1